MACDGVTRAMFAVKIPPHNDARFATLELVNSLVLSPYPFIK